MELIAGYRRTGRQLLGPGSDLIEVQAEDGTRLTAVTFHPEYRSHNAINAALSVVIGFLESPMVSGLAELAAHDREQAAFLYATGEVWSVAEVIRTLSDLGESGGTQAGLELLGHVGTILVEAAEAGENAGVYSHGGLTPWRVMLDGEGKVVVIGHALPQVEILVFHESPDRIPREDAFRYCPPERMEARRENFTTDLFSLALIAFELMMGRPVYDGLINDIRTKAARGETSRRLQQFKDALPGPVRELLTTALRPELRDRFPSGQAFLDAVDEVRRSGAAQGASLRDVMQRVSKHQPRSRQELDPARTAMLSKEELRRMAEEEDGPPARAARQSFAPPARPPPTPAAEAVPPAPPPPEAAPQPAPLPLPAGRRPPRLSTSNSGEPARAVLATSGNGVRTAIPAARPPPRLAGVTSGDRSAPLAPAPPPPEPASEAPALPTPTFGGARLPPARRAPSVEQPPPVELAPESECDPPTGPVGEHVVEISRLRAGLNVAAPVVAAPVAAVAAAVVVAAPVVAAPVPAPVVAAPAPEPAASPRGAPLLRAPTALRPLGRGELVAVRFSRAPGLKGHRLRLPADTTLAEAAHRLVGELVSLRCAPDGRLLGWYRIGNDLGPLPPDGKVGDLDDDETYCMHFVENSLIWLSLSVQGHQVAWNVGIAVPVASLIDAAALQFGLPDGTWHLWCGQRRLDDFDVLADYPNELEAGLQLRTGAG